jgi:hypothetical protein
MCGKHCLSARFMNGAEIDERLYLALRHWQTSLASGTRPDPRAAPLDSAGASEYRGVLAIRAISAQKIVRMVRPPREDA